MKILAEEGVDQRQVMIDHNTEETMPLFAGTEYFVGLTVYPVTKLSPERAVNIARQYGIERLIVNSSADWGPSDVLSVPKVAQSDAQERLQPGRGRAAGLGEPDSVLLAVTQLHGAGRARSIWRRPGR